MTASNTWECFQKCVGKRITGVLCSPGHGAAGTTKWLILDDGTALVIGVNGSYWLEYGDAVRRVVSAELTRLQRVQADLADAMQADGLLPSRETRP